VLVVMSGGNPVLVSVMYSPRAPMRWGSVHRLASCPREETSSSRRFRALERAGQVRIACVKDSGLISHRGQVVSGFRSNQERWAARYHVATRIWWILPATNFSKPMKGCGESEAGCS